MNSPTLSAVQKQIPSLDLSHLNEAKVETPMAAPSLVPHVQAAIARGFYVFPLASKGKLPLPGTHGFKDSKSPSDPLAVAPWSEDANRNIGIDLGASNLCVLDFDKPEFMPGWINELKTYKVASSKGLHVYLRGARKTTKLYVDGNPVGDLKSEGGYVLAEGSVHPDGPVYTVIDTSPIADLPDRVSELVKHETERVNASVDGPPIPHGRHDIELTRIAGLLRGAGFTADKIEEHLIEVCEGRCEGYGSDYRQMCHKIANSIGKKPVGQADPVAVLGSSQVQVADISNWRSAFRNLAEMEDGEIVMVIDGVLQEGVCFFGGTAGHGKTLVALSFAKAICLGEPLFGNPDYSVKQPRNVIYLIPESGDRAFRKRGEAFRLPKDDRFIARTISSGGPLALSDPALMEAVRQLKPVVFLDTASRFMRSNDENSSAQNRLLVDDVIALRAAGAVSVIILHHAKKSATENRESMTLENMLRGTSDFGAMCDQAYGIRLDDRLRARGAGPTEIDVENLKDRESLGGLTSIRLAASYKKSGAIVPVSYINETGNFHTVNYRESKAQLEETLNQLVVNNPMMSVAELSASTGITVHGVRHTLRQFGWHVAKGGSAGHSPWHKDEGKPCPFARPEKVIYLDEPAKPDKRAAKVN